MTESKDKLPELEAALARILSKEHKGITGLDAILISLHNQAIKGDVKAAQLLLERAYKKVSVNDETEQPEKTDWMSQNPLRAVK